VQAIILAAGKGTRLAPIADNFPKPTLKLAGKTILERIVHVLVNNGVKEILLIINDQEEIFRNIFDKADIENIKIRYIEQKEKLGTAHAVQMAFPYISNDFIIVNGDILLFDDDVKNIIGLYREEDVRCILGTKVENYQTYGVLLLNENKEIIDVIEKPQKLENENWLVNAGFYIFKREDIEDFVKVEKSIRNEYELTSVIQNLLIKDCRFKIFKMNNPWFDIGYPWEILNANEFLMDYYANDFKINCELEPNVTVIGQVHIENGCRIRSGSYIEGPVYIAKGSDIGPNCYIRPSTFIDEDCRIGNACEVKNSIMYKGSHAGHLSYVGDSIIGKNCNLGAGTLTANLRHDNKTIKITIKNKRIDSNRRKIGVIMGDFVKTGINVSILPGVKISANSFIQAGSVVSRDL
jgi:UDP-N-acetylglucosamine diphosphorylase / glucose-1-phosphate thymidylyltransferase / UDP-N-acetylgalactosamine diphosphorylase / glucosamine-1-phosphate N-acetyltransferase / galactosamine-1-phosphate N-acetyltransferase